MKRLFAFALCAVMLFSCAACGSEGGRGSGAKSNAASPEHTVSVAIGAGFSSLDPAREYEKYPPLILNACYENLFKFYSNDDEAKPCLAESYDFSEDGRTLTVRLKENAVFASGNPVTSEDVKFSIERCRNLQSNPAFICDTISNITTPDPHTAVIHLTRPDSAILSKLTYSALAILDSAVVKEHGGSATMNAVMEDSAESFLNTTSAGSGMYVMTSYRLGEEIVLEKNPNYWGTPTNVDKYIIRIQPDSEEQRALLAAGELDVAMNMTDATMAELAGAEGVKLLSGATKTVGFIMMNLSPYVGGPVSDEHVQQAIRLALDYRGIQELVGEGCITPYSLIQDGFMGSKGERPADYTNIEAAKAELALSPYPNGFSTELTVCDLDMEGVALADLAEKVKEDLAQIGIQVNVVVQPWDIEYSSTYRGGGVGFTVMYWSADYNDPNVQLEFLPGMTVGLRAGWTAAMDLELNAQYERAMSATDTNERERVLGEIQDMMFEHGPFIFIAQAPAHIGYSARLSGVEVSDPYALDLTQIHINE